MISAAECWQSILIGYAVTASGTCVPTEQDHRERPTKVAQTFFVLDVDTGQPVCFTTGTSARRAATAAEELLKLAADDPRYQTRSNAGLGRFGTLHQPSFWTESRQDTNFELLVPMPAQPSLLAKLRSVAVGEVSAALGRLCDHETGLHSLRTARLGHSTSTSSVKESGRRTIASTRSSQPAMATRLRS